MADRTDVINRIYYQGMGQLEADPEGLAYWSKMAAENGWDDNELKRQILGSANMDGKSVHEDVMADQSYGAFLRKMQFDESTVQSSLAAAKEAAARRITGQAGMYDTQREQGAKNVQQGFENRGMQRSGGRLKNLSENRSAIDLQQNRFEDQTREGVAGQEREAATRIADMRRERAEQEVSARDRLTMRSAGM